MLADFFWPRGGWSRAATYVKHRLHRLPDPPHRIARGIMAGVFVVFTPFYGLHFFMAAGLALLLRGNVVAALLGTFVGNPLTYVPIGVICLQTGYAILGRPTLAEDELNRSLGRKFVDAGEDLWTNFLSVFSHRSADWHNLKMFYDDVFFPYMIGGLVPGIIMALAAYYVSLPVITAYQNRRRGLLKAKWAAMKEKKAQGENTTREADERGKGG
ncbi:MAG: DUF2062 domain-containing protein [Pseudomonadota bacterium]